MEKSMHPIVQLARKAVEAYVEKKEVIKPEKLTPEMQEQAGVFISLKKYGQLRGCIGTFEPTQPNIAEEIVRNAISSATFDPRFPPVHANELSELEYSVDVLTPPEVVKSEADLDPKKYGLIVKSGYRRGLLLPDLEGIDDVATQLSICRQKAHIGPTEPVELYRFMVKRYR